MFLKIFSAIAAASVLVACQSAPQAEMVIVPGPKGTFTAESTSATKVEALKGAKYAAEKECKGMDKRVEAGETTFKDLRQKKPDAGLAGAAAAIFQDKGRDNDSFSASMKFSCK